MDTVYRRYVGPVARLATRLDGREHVLRRGDVVEVSEEQAEALDRQNVVDDDGEVVEASWEEADASDYTAQQEPDDPPEDANQDGGEDGPPEFETVTVDDVDEAADDEQEDHT